MRRFMAFAICGATSVALLSIASQPRLISDEPQKIISINAQDIGKNFQIIGRLGKPIGTLMSLRGQWHVPTDLSKPADLEFHVTDVEGKPLEKPVIFFNVVVNAINLKDQHEHVNEGVVWEMRAFEDGRFVNLREQHWKEFYGAPPAPADYGQYPFVCFLTGNVKKEIRPTPGTGSEKPQ